MTKEPPALSMTERILALIERRTNEPDGNLPNTDLIPGFVSCNDETKTMEISYVTRHWMRNPMNVVHGGVIGILMDNAMGLATYAMSGKPTPTINMNINYLRPVPLDATVIVRTQVVNFGKTTAYTTAEIFLPDQPDRILVTASGVYTTTLAPIPD